MYKHFGDCISFTNYEISGLNLIVQILRIKLRRSFALTGIYELILCGSFLKNIILHIFVEKNTVAISVIIISRKDKLSF